MDNLKSIIPVLITPNKFLYTETDTSNKIFTTRCESYKGLCDYLFWTQTYPENQGENSLSWVITPNRVPEVIQFLALQLCYEIEWKSDIPLKRKQARVLLVQPVNPTENNFAYEPWDIYGNRIKFLGKRGCFILPGMYGQFIIECLSNANMKLKITAFEPPINYWNYVSENGSRICKDGNYFYSILPSDPEGYNERILNLKYLEYERFILEEYHKNPGIPCKSDEDIENYLQVSDTLIIDFQSPFGTSGNAMGDYCSNMYTNPFITTDLKDIAFRVSSDSGQFSLLPNRKYRVYVSSVDIGITAESYTFNQAKELGLIEPINTYKSGPYLACDNRKISFYFYSVSQKDSVTFTSTSTPAHPGTIGNKIAFYFDENIEGIGENSKLTVETPADVEYYYDFTSLSDSPVYAVRLNTFWISWENGSGQPIYLKGPTIFEATLKLQLLN